MATDHQNPASKQQQPGTSAFKVRGRGGEGEAEEWQGRAEEGRKEGWVMVGQSMIGTMTHCKIFQSKSYTVLNIISLYNLRSRQAEHSKET